MVQILIIDLGSQLCHLIARRVRQLGVYSEVVPNSITIDDLARHKDLAGIILSGGPSSIYEKGAPSVSRTILDSGIPILGICYGHQLLASFTGGTVKGGVKKEYGYTTLTLHNDSPLFSSLPRTQKVWMNHGDIVASVGQGFRITASTENSPAAAFEHPEKRLFGVQFHIEVTHTEHGQAIIENFIFTVCGATKDWSIEDFAERQITLIREQIGRKKAIIGLSGGVDSTTCAALVSKAIGRNLKAIFIDTGFMRKGEAEEIRTAFSGWDLDLSIIDSQDRFLEALRGVSDPEQKRKIIGRIFIEEFEREAKAVDAEFLVQGTIYPDIIESGSSDHAAVIKSHHNVGGLPKDMRLKLCEPLRDLYKDEVRSVASSLSIPESLISRHPFPGPGLAIRILGECTRENVRIVKEANSILLDELKEQGFYHSTWQAFAVLLPVKSVGVQGDARAYKQVIALRLVDSIDAMTANFTHVPYEILEKISTRITNEITEIGRVVYDITNKPPGTIEWE